jgi:hypothetical protein
MVHAFGAVIYAVMYIDLNVIIIQYFFIIGPACMFYVDIILTKS